ncbi:MAG: hypothetical protein ACRDIV_19455 [Ktedonobacteraceae bacterium]
MKELSIVAGWYRPTFSPQHIYLSYNNAAFALHVPCRSPDAMKRSSQPTSRK